jgi:hypothetical protein
MLKNWKRRDVLIKSHHILKEYNKKFVVWTNTINQLSLINPYPLDLYRMIQVTLTIEIPITNSPLQN